MHHNGDTVTLPMGPYELDDPMIVAWGRPETWLRLELIKLATLIQEHVQSERFPLTDGDQYVIELNRNPPKDYDVGELRRYASKLGPIAGAATVFITEWVDSLDQGLKFEKTDDGYFAIVPDHACGGRKCRFNSEFVTAEAARILAEGGLPEHKRDEYGKCVEAGFRIDPGAGPHEPIGEGSGARVSYKVPNEDLTNPERRSSDEVWLEKYGFMCIYAYVLRCAGWLTELRKTPSNDVIVLARPKDGGE